MVGRPSRSSKSDRETLPKFWNWYKDPQEVWYWSGDKPGGPEVVGRHFQRSGSGRETLLKVQMWSGDPPGGSEVVERPSRRSGSNRGTLPEVRSSGSDWGTLTEVRKWSGTLPEVQKWSGHPP